jgi:Tfp pilus assembly protein PilN
MSARIVSVRYHTGQVEEELVALQPALDKIAAFDLRREQLQPKIACLDGAQHATLRWHTVLTDLQQAIPPQTWLTGLAVERGADENAQTLRLNGVTVSQKLVGEAMLRLNQQPLYRTVNLHYTQAAKSGEKDTVEFELAAQLQPIEGTTNEVAKPQAQ